MNWTNSRFWLRNTVHIANTDGHFFHSLIHIFFCTERLITLSAPFWAYCHVLDLHSIPCTLHSCTQNKEGKKKLNKVIIPIKRSKRSFVCGSQATSFRVSCCSALCGHCIFSIPGFRVKRSWHTTVPDRLEWSITQLCQLNPFFLSPSFGSL